MFGPRESTKVSLVRLQTVPAWSRTLDTLIVPVCGTDQQKNTGEMLNT